MIPGSMQCECGCLDPLDAKAMAEIEGHSHPACCSSRGTPGGSGTTNPPAAAAFNLDACFTAVDHSPVNSGKVKPDV
jgi:hypothetical protein